MDQLASHHLGPAKMVVGSGEEFWVRWYPSAPGAKPFPFPHAFGSSVWITDYLTDDPTVGMQGPPPGPGLKVPSPYQWAPKKYPAPPGQHWHGDPQWFLTGLPPDQLHVGPLTDACGTPVIDAEGGVCCCGSSDMGSLPSVGAVGGGDLVLDGSTTVSISVLVLDKALISPILPVDGTLPLPDATCMLLTLPTGSIVRGLSGGIHGRIVTIEMTGGTPFRITNEDPVALPSDRVKVLNNLYTSYWVGYSRTYQYDGGISRWRELSAVPLISQPGDILTATDSGPEAFPVSPDQGHVLTAQPSQPERLGWGDGKGGSGGGGDINYHRQADETTVLGRRYYGGSYLHATVGSHGHITNRVLQLLPFESPRGGHVGALGCYIANPGGPGSVYALAIYRAISGENKLPGRLVVATAVQDMTVTGSIDVAVDWSPVPTELYYIAFVGNDPSAIATFTVWPSPPSPWHPLYGMDDHMDDFTLLSAYRIVNDIDATLLPDPCPVTADAVTVPNLLVRVGVRYDG